MGFLKNMLFGSNIFLFENIIRDIRKDNIKTVKIRNTRVATCLNNREGYDDAEMIFNVIKHGELEWITLDQIRLFMRNIGFYIQKSEIDYLFAEIDHDKSLIGSHNQITLDKFGLFLKQFVEYDNAIDIIKTTFNTFDRCGKGFITATDVLNVLKKISINLSESDLRDMIDETNGNRSGIITFQDFIRCLYDQETEN